MILMQHYQQCSLEYLLYENSFVQLLDMFSTIGKDYREFVLKKKPNKKNPWGNFKLPSVSIQRGKQ